MTFLETKWARVFLVVGVFAFVVAFVVLLVSRPEDNRFERFYVYQEDAEVYVSGGFLPFPQDCIFPDNEELWWDIFGDPRAVCIETGLSFDDVKAALWSLRLRALIMDAEGLYPYLLAIAKALIVTCTTLAIAGLGYRIVGWIRRGR